MKHFKEQIEKVNLIWDEIQNDLTKFTEKGNNAASTRARNNAMEIIKEMKNLREKILNIRKENK